MAQPYVGEVRMFAGNFPPAGWAFCEGQELPISENETLFNLIGTTYGGDGQSTFKVPDLRGRIPIHNGMANYGTTFTLGELAGVETVTLATTQIPSHAHPLLASSDIGTQGSPKNNVLAQSAAKLYRAGNPSQWLQAQSVALVGGSQPHENRQPYLCVSFIISLFGIFPSPT
jgi:microcystin-dependent protein